MSNNSEFALFSQVYDGESHTFTFFVKELATGMILPYQPMELLFNKQIMAQLPVKHCERIAYIAGLQQGEATRFDILSFRQVPANIKRGRYS
jgi:hypothetical protein